MADSNRLIGTGMPVQQAVEVAAQIDGSGGGVASVNGQTGAVVLDASDVGALPDDYAPTAADISDSTATGRSVLTGSAADGRTALELGTAAQLNITPQTEPSADLGDVIAALVAAGIFTAA